jgi:hypothetical protein
VWSRLRYGQKNVHAGHAAETIAKLVAMLPSRMEIIVYSWTHMDLRAVSDCCFALEFLVVRLLCPGHVVNIYGGLLIEVIVVDNSSYIECRGL